MKKSILSRYHVDEVPNIIKPLFYLYGYGIPLIGFFYCFIVHITSKIVFIGKENLNERSNYIFCFWHSFIFFYFTIFLRNRLHAWMQHPTWFMKPAHVMLRFIGVKKIVLGSTGHSGKEAADRLVGYLKRGYSTVILPDGPSGPPFKMKKGALHIKETHYALFCPTCKSVKVFSKYVCPHCESDNVNQVKLIEHSLCGYTGMIEEFDTGTHYACPNCKVDFGAIDGKSLGDESKGDY